MPGSLLLLLLLAADWLPCKVGSSVIPSPLPTLFLSKEEENEEEEKKRAEDCACQVRWPSGGDDDSMRKKGRQAGWLVGFWH